MPELIDPFVKRPTAQSVAPLAPSAPAAAAPALVDPMMPTRPRAGVSAIDAFDAARTTSNVPDPNAPDFKGSFVRGFKRTLPEDKELLGAAGIAAGQALGAPSITEASKNLYETGKSESEPLAGTSLGDVIEGKAPLRNWAGDTLGNFAGQAVQSAAAGAVGAAVGGVAGSEVPGVGNAAGAIVGGIGGIIGKKALMAQARETAAKYIAEQSAKGVAKDVVDKGAADIVKAAGKVEAQKLGAGVGAGVLNAGQEIGSAVENRLDQGTKPEDMTRDQAVQAIIAGTAAGAIDTATEAVNLGHLMHGGSANPSVLRRVLAESAGGALREGATEAAQSVLERVGGGASLTDEAALRDYGESAAAGVLGGGVLEAPAGLHRPKPHVDTTTTAAQPATTQATPAAAPVTPAGPVSTGAATPADEPVAVKRPTPTPFPTAAPGSIADVANVIHTTKNTSTESAAPAQPGLSGLIDPMAVHRQQVQAEAAKKEEAPKAEPEAASEPAAAAPAKQAPPPPSVPWINAETGEIGTPSDDELKAELHARADAIANTGRGLNSKTLSNAWGVPAARIKALYADVKAERRDGMTSEQARARVAAPVDETKSTEGTDNVSATGEQPSGDLAEHRDGSSGEEAAQASDRDRAEQRAQDERAGVHAPEAEGEVLPAASASGTDTAAPAAGEPAAAAEDARVAAPPAEEARTTATGEEGAAGRVLDSSQPEQAPPTEAPSAGAEQTQEKPASLDEAAATAATHPESPHPEPTDAQKEAGNYKKGHVNLNGLDISIENPAGTKRRPEWPALKQHYGYIKRTEGADGEHVDAFMGKHAEDASRPVFVVDQVDPKTRAFDEHKVMLGFTSAFDARKAYTSNYTKGWKGFGGIKEMSQDEFKAWLKDGDTTKPVAPQEAAAPKQAAANKPTVLAKDSQVLITKGAYKGQTGRVTSGTTDGLHNVIPAKGGVAIIHSDNLVDLRARPDLGQGDPGAVSGDHGVRAVLRSTLEGRRKVGSVDSGNVKWLLRNDYAHADKKGALSLTEKGKAELARLDEHPDSPYSPEARAARGEEAAPAAAPPKQATHVREEDLTDVQSVELPPVTGKHGPPLAELHTGQRADGSFAVRAAFNTTRDGSGGPFDGRYATREEAARAGLDSIERHLGTRAPDNETHGKHREKIREFIADQRAKLEPQSETKPAPAAPAKEANPFAKNKLFTADKVEAARARMKAKLSTLNTGLDPELLVDGLTIAGAHIEAGVRAFGDYAAAMVKDFGDGIKPYLLSFYEAARHYPGLETKGMDTPEAASQAHSALTAEPANPEGGKAVETQAPQAENAGAEGTENAARELDRAGARALEGAPAGAVQAAGSERNAERETAGSGGRNRTRDAGTRGRGVRSRQRVGAGAGEVSVPAGGAGSERGSAAERGLLDAGGSEPNAVAAAAAGHAQAVDPPQFSPADFTIGEELPLGEGGDKTKYKRNVDAIKLLRDLDATGRPATPEEQRTLSQYVGWGGLAPAFDESNAKWAKEFAELKDVLTPEEYEDARQSTQYAHYTSREVINGIYDAVSRLGFTGGKVMEAGGGVGNFIGLMPAEMRTAGRFTLVEREPIAAGIAKHLYPQQNVLHADFTEFGKGQDGHYDAQIGNPPFARTALTDKSGRKHLTGLRVHNYFIAKGIDLLREGGVLANVVSNGFLDSTDDRARRYIGERARFLGAIRLPNNAFAKNAGTEVTTDIVFFQKLPESEWGGKAAKDDMKRWVGTRSVADPNGGTDIKTNAYFAEHPEMMLGEWTKAGQMYRPDLPALVARDGQNTAKLLAEAVKQLPEGVYQAAAIAKTESMAAGLVAQLHDTANVSEGGFYRADDKLWQRLPDRAGEKIAQPITPDMKWTEKTTLGASGFKRIGALSDMRTTLRSLLAAELGDDAKGMKALRKTLNEQYDAYVSEFGRINDAGTARYFDDDPDYPLLAALEFNYAPGIGAAAAKTAGIKPTKSTATKAPIFKQRVIEARKPVTKAETPADALAISMAERGNLDAEYIGKLLDRDPHAVLDELASGEKPLLFKDPATGEYVLRDAYLSGNVRKKLAQAKAAGLVSHALELEKVIPTDVGAGEISARVGSPWVPTETYQDFATHLLGEGTKASLHYLPLNSSYSGVIHAGSTVAENTTFGTKDVPASELLMSLLNNRDIKVLRRDSDGKTFTDKQATEDANTKAQEIREKFNDWLFADPDRAEKLVRVYNDTNNNYVTRKYDGAFMSFPGKVPDSIIKFRRHQRDFIARSLQDRTALADHVVGAGKTYSAIAAAMEMKRTGIARKPMIAVPNHLVKQWAADFYRLYPGANILTATKKDFERSNRRRFLARIATGNWDAVIIAHSSFGFIKPAPEFETRFNEKQVAAIKQTIDAVESGDDDERAKKRTVKQLEAMVERIENRIAALRQKPMDDLLDFAEIGVDQMFVDEMHLYKNLMFSTKMQNIRGLGDPKGSQRAYDMLLKVEQLYEQNGRGQGLIALTGTPVSNSLAEMYHMMRYLMPRQLEEQGFGSFDAWANTFASIDQTLKPTTAGGYKNVNQFGAFTNTAELLAFFDQVSDTVTMDDIKAAFREENNGKEFPLPKLKTGRRQPIALERSPAQTAYMAEIAKRAAALETRKGPPKKGEDNHLSLMSDARKAAMDIRLVDPKVTEREPGGRIDRAASEILDRYNKWNADKGTQLVFSDLGTPLKHAKRELKEYNDLRARVDKAQSEQVQSAAALGDEGALATIEDGDKAQAELDAHGQDWRDAVEAALRGFSVYDDLKAALVERGIPANEIAFIHDYNTDDQKAGLFRKVNAGDIRVLLGSTAKMGAGTNVQERLVAEHHLDIPWRPSDVEQREGRIIRQGNKLADTKKDFEAEILAYVTKDTLDKNMWDVQERKLRGINQLRTRQMSREIENSFEEMEMSASEMQAAATGNLDLLKEIQLKNEVQKIERKKRSFDATRADLASRAKRAERTLKDTPPKLAAHAALAKHSEAYEKALAAHAKGFEVTIDGKKYTDRDQAGRVLREMTDATEPDGKGGERAKPIKVDVNGETYTARAKLADAFSAIAGDFKRVAWDVDGNTLRRRTEIEKAISAAAADAISDHTRADVGKLGAFTVSIEGDPLLDGQPGAELHVVVTSPEGQEVTSSFAVAAGETAVAKASREIVQRAEALVQSQPDAVRSLQHEMDRAQRTLDETKAANTAETFPDQAKLDDLRAQHKAIVQKIKAAAENKTETAAPAAAPAAPETATEPTELSASDMAPSELAAFQRQGLGAQPAAPVHDLHKETLFANAVLRKLGMKGVVRVVALPEGAKSALGGQTSGKYNGSTFTISLAGHLRGAERIEVLSHELGHHIIAQQLGRELDRASPELRAALDADYNAWVRANFASDKTVGDVLSSRKPVVRGERIARRGGATLADLTAQYGDKAAEYLYDREEWLADHIARALTQKQEATGLIEQFFGHVAALLRSAYNALFGGARAKYATAPSVDAWVQSLFDRTAAASAEAAASAPAMEMAPHDIADNGERHDADLTEAPAVSIDHMDMVLGKPDGSMFERAKAWLRGKFEDFRPAMLGALQLRHLTELMEGEPSLKGAQYYADLHQRMDADRNAMLTGAPDATDHPKDMLKKGVSPIADFWRSWAYEKGPAGWLGKLTPMAKQLASLMHDATIEGIDPSGPYKKLTFENSRGEPVAWTREGIAQRIKEIRDQMRGRPGDDKREMMATVKSLRALPKREAAREKKFPQLQARFMALSPEAKETYSQVRDWYGAHRDATESALIARIKMLDMPETYKRAMVDRVRREFEANRVEGVYFPLDRNGDYWMAVSDKEGAQGFKMFESAADLEAAEKKLKAAGFTVDASGRRDAQYRAKDAPSGTFVADVIEKLQKAGAPKGVQDEIYQMFLKTLPEMSMRKRRIHRKAIPGFSEDAQRAFAKNGFHGSHQLARLRYSARMGITIEAMEKAAANFRKDAPALDAARVDALLSELKKRHDFIMSPKDTKIGNLANSVGFIYYLGATPASALVNMTQGAQVTLPVLGAHHGWPKALRYLGAATRDAIRTGGNIQRTLTSDDEKRAYRVLEARGDINRTQSHTLAGQAEGNTLTSNPGWAKTMGFISGMFHRAEIINREAAGMASYRLAKSEGKTFEQAIQYASEIINGTHFDYSAANRPRYMQGNTARVALQFKNYSVSMTWLLYRNLYQAFKGETPETRRLARRTLTGVLGMTSLLAGTTGLPIINLAKLAANAAHAAFGDDDEPWDFMTEFRAWLKEHFGETGASLIADGAVNTLGGVDVASRVSLSNLWTRDADRELEGEDAYYDWLDAVVGPIGGMTKNFFVGSKEISDGHVWRGVEQMMPKAAKDSMKALRFAHEGVNSLRGDPIVPDVGPGETLAQGLGFRPTRIADQQRENNALKNYEQHILDRRQGLMNAYAMSIHAGDDSGRAAAVEGIRAFNAKYPQIALNAATIRKSMQERARYTRNAENGVFINRKLAPQLRDAVGAQ